jgi:reductive dehalogenase
MDEWESKYVAGPIEQFIEKHTMFNRTRWDPDVKDLVKNWAIAGSPKDKAGYTMDALALRWGSNAGTRLSILDAFKPNPNPINKAVAEAISTASANRPSMIYTPPEGTKVDTSDQGKITLMIKKVSKWFGADLVGICKLDRRWLYASAATGDGLATKGISDEYQYVIVLAYEMDYTLIKYFNTHTANAATRMGYSRMAITNAHLAQFIRQLGYKAIESGNDIGLSVPMAMQAGLGDIGRHGLLITPEFGPRVRLSKILTDLPLLVDSPIDFGITEFCRACMKCADKCPSQAISYNERTPEPNNKSNNTGEMKWPINAEICRTYWARSAAPCVSCLATCPYNKPYTRFHRTVRWLADHARWADSFYVKMDDLFGYGKAQKADNFWEEWHPKNGFSST